MLFAIPAQFPRACPLSSYIAAAAALLLLAVTAPARAGQVDLSNAHLSDLLVPGNYAIVGNERFDSFTFSATESGGATRPIRRIS